MENYGSFRGFGYIYIYRLIHRNKFFFLKKKTMEFILKNYQKLE